MPPNIDLEFLILRLSLWKMLFLLCDKRSLGSDHLSSEIELETLLLVLDYCWLLWHPLTIVWFYLGPSILNWSVTGALNLEGYVKQIFFKARYLPILYFIPLLEVHIQNWVSFLQYLILRGFSSPLQDLLKFVKINIYDLGASTTNNLRLPLQVEKKLL
jgi:hypothetical protein